MIEQSELVDAAAISRDSSGETAAEPKLIVIARSKRNRTRALKNSIDINARYSTCVMSESDMRPDIGLHDLPSQNSFGPALTISESIISGCARRVGEQAKRTVFTARFI